MDSDMESELVPPPLSQRHLPPGPQSTQAQRAFHPGFSLDPRPIVFSVEDQCFKVDASRLLPHSKFLRSMLEDKKSHIGKPQEGTEEFPLVLEGYTASAFANFLSWLNHYSWAPLQPDHIQQLLDILHISHIWGVKNAVEFASNQIRDRFPLEPAHALYLAGRYGIEEWVDGAVRALMAKPLKDYTHSDQDYIGFGVYSAIAAAKEEIAKERARLMTMPPYPKPNKFDEAEFCPPADHVRCKRIWGDVWFTKVLRRINSSDPLPLNLLPDFLDSVDHNGMNPNCKRFLVTWFRSSCDDFNKEEDMMVATINFILALLPPNKL